MAGSIPFEFVDRIIDGNKRWATFHLPRRMFRTGCCVFSRIDERGRNRNRCDWTLAESAFFGRVREKEKERGKREGIGRQ